MIFKGLFQPKLLYDFLILYCKNIFHQFKWNIFHLRTLDQNDLAFLPPYFFSGNCWQNWFHFTFLLHLPGLCCPQGSPFPVGFALPWPQHSAPGCKLKKTFPTATLCCTHAGKAATEIKLQIFTEVKLATFAIFAVGSFFLLLFSFCFFCIFCSNIKSFKCLLSHHPGLPQYVKQLQWLPGTSLPVFRKDSCSLGPRCAWTQSLSFALIFQVILKLIWW